MKYSPEMKNFVLVIGPSGIGKSTLCHHYSMLYPAVKYYDLDNFIKHYNNETSLNDFRTRIGEENFLEATRESLEVIRSMSQTEILMLIDVGAGSINNHSGHLWFQLQDTIALYSNPEILYDRLLDKKKSGRDLIAYKADEYTAERLNLYNNTKLLIDITALSIEESKISFTQKLDEFIK